MKYRKSVFLLTVLAALTLAPGLQPPAEAIVCKVDALGAWLNTAGRLVIRVRAGGALRVWNLCDTEVSGKRIAPSMCRTYLDLTLIAGSTEVPLQLGFNNSVLTDQVAARGVGWDGTCSGIVSWTVVEPALSSFEIHQ